jgi:hypothetical protein
MGKRDNPTPSLQNLTMYGYNFMLVYPPCAGTSLGETCHQVTITAERPTDAYRRLWTTVDDMRKGGTGANCAVPDVYQWHGPREIQKPLISD